MTDEHLPKHAAMLFVETGIEVDVSADGTVSIDGRQKLTPALMDEPFELTPFQARLLSDALLEATDLAEGKNLFRQPPKGTA